MGNVIVIGGGAAGMMAAYAAAKNGNSVDLIEKNEKLGKKIYITGKGRCNVTNNVDARSFLENVVRNPKFMTSSIYSFTPQDTISLLEENGVKTKTERGNRVFPVSDHASDVTKALQKACEKVGVRIHLNEKVEEIKIIDSTMSGIITNKRSYSCDKAIVCTGGLSYPTTGSTGDGYRFAEEAGIAVTETKPSLTGINLKGKDFVKMQGLALKNVTLTAKRGEKTIYEGFGEMLFTHYGISGPIVLTLSSLLADKETKNCSLFLDLKPALDETKLDARLLRDFSELKNKNVSNAMAGLLPSTMIPCVLEKAMISPQKQVNSVTKEERSRLIRVLKAYPMTPLSLRGFDEAIVTCGGVSVKEINPKTMESKKVKGLYFCGEVLDVDAYTGGFNLQIAFSTGFAAGNSILSK